MPWHVVRLDLHPLLLPPPPQALGAGGGPSPQRQQQTAARDATTSAVAAHATGRLPKRDQPWPTARVSQHSGKVVVRWSEERGDGREEGEDGGDGGWVSGWWEGCRQFLF